MPAISMNEHHEAIARKYPYEIQFVGGLSSGSLVFQPRDGTRYVITFRSIWPEEAAVLGSSFPAAFVSVMRGPNKYVSLVIDHAPHRLYIEEKLGVSPQTARQLERALDYLFAATDPGPFTEEV